MHSEVSSFILYEVIAIGSVIK